MLDTGVSKSCMSKSYYLRCKALHDLPKFASKTQRIQVGNGHYVRVLFVILVIAEICGHKRIGKEEGRRMNIDFGESPEVLKGKYMDVYVTHWEIQVFR